MEQIVKKKEGCIGERNRENKIKLKYNTYMQNRYQYVMQAEECKEEKYLARKEK